MTTNNRKPEKQPGMQLSRAVIYSRPAAETPQAPQRPQIHDLETLAREHGFTDITVFAERHIPGNTAFAYRDAFKELGKAIEEQQEKQEPGQKPITAIIVASVDRLFRSPGMLEDIALFLNLCSSHGVTVITPTATYDFSNQADVVRFCFACQTTSLTIERVTLNRLHEGKRAAAARRKANTTKVAIYAKVASPILCTRHPAQTEQLLALARQLGFAERQIIIFDQDHGRQGNSGIAQREGLSALFTAIEQDRIQAILVANENRLFRDAEAIQVNAFIRLCAERTVLVITPQTTYDFTNPSHVSLFRFHCEHGYSLLETLEK